MRILFLSFHLFLLCSSLAYAKELSLIEAFHEALHFDMTMQSAKKDNEIQHAEVDKSSALFYPQARLLMYQGRSFTDSTTPTTFSGSATTSLYRKYDSKNYGFTVRQSLFNKSNYAAFNQAREAAYKSDAILQKENLDLMARICGSYLDILMALDNIEYSEMQKFNMEVQLQSAEERYKNGVGTITEINEANANLESVVAKKLEWDNTLEYSRRILETYIGRYPTDVLRLNSQKLPKEKPNPPNIESWINFSLEKNPEIIAAQHDIEIAAAEIDKSIAGHYPTLDLVASKSFTDSQNDYTIGSRYNTNAIGLQLEVPIYYGGYVEANTKSSIARLEQSKYEFLKKQLEIRSNVRKYFHEIINGLSRLDAFEKVVASNEIALTGTIKGFEAGFRTNIEVLNAQEKLYMSKHDLSKERYTLIYNRILLKQSAGTLSEQDIQEISGWLSAKNS